MSTKKRKKTVWFGMKLTPEQKDKIRRLAEKRGVSQKQAVMDLVEEKTMEEPIQPTPGSFLDRNRHLWGSGNSGKGDLSTNKEYLEGFGQ